MFPDPRWISESIPSLTGRAAELRASATVAPVLQPPRVVIRDRYIIPQWKCHNITLPHCLRENRSESFTNKHWKNTSFKRNTSAFQLNTTKNTSKHFWDKNAFKSFNKCITKITSYRKHFIIIRICYLMVAWVFISAITVNKMSLAI